MVYYKLILVLCQSGFYRLQNKFPGFPILYQRLEKKLLTFSRKGTALARVSLEILMESKVIVGETSARQNWRYWYAAATCWGDDGVMVLL